MSTTSILGLVGAILGSAGLAALVFFLATNQVGVLTRRWLRYVALLEKERGFQLLEMSSKRIARYQLLAAGIMIALAVVTKNAILLLVIIGVIFGPYLYLRRRSDERRLQLEEQLDSWLLMLSNALKATPAIGDAMRSTVQLIRSPIREEVSRIVKENQLGTPLDQAILNNANRIESPMINGAFAALVIARQTGGDLSDVLEKNAEALREQQRLEGVVRTKTAEVKGQLVVLAAFPAVMVLIISLIEPGWFTPLTQSSLGFVVLLACSVLWVVAILWANKILDVNL